MNPLYSEFCFLLSSNSTGSLCGYGASDNNSQYFITLNIYWYYQNDGEAAWSRHTWGTIQQSALSPFLRHITGLETTGVIKVCRLCVAPALRHIVTWPPGANGVQRGWVSVYTADSKFWKRRKNNLMQTKYNTGLSLSSNPIMKVTHSLGRRCLLNKHISLQGKLAGPNASLKTCLQLST